MRRVVIFGTGQLYEKYKKQFKPDIQIIAFLDNDPQKWGRVIDGVKVLSPEKVKELSYDIIFLLSASSFQMRRQLVSLGIPMHCVYDRDHAELLFPTEGIKVYQSKAKVKEQKKRIVLFSYDLSATGANVILLRMALIYSEIGCEVSLFSREDGELRDNYLWAGITVTIVPDMLFFSDVWKDDVANATLVIVNTFWFYYLIQEMEKNQKAKVLWWIHETFPFSIVSKEQFVECTRDLWMTACVSPLVKREIEKKFDYKDVSVFLWGITDRESKRKRKDGKIVFAIIGAIESRIKGQDVFLNAIASLSALERANTEFWIVGAGMLSDKEAELVENYPCVKQIGYVAQEEIPKLYAEIDVLVCASRIEALSVTSVEAFMNRKPTIISDAVGIIDYVTPGKNSLVFHSGDSRELAETMRWVINNREEAMDIGRKGRCIYDEYFTMERFEQRIHSLLKDIDAR